MAERLTLEDAITHAKEVAERNRKQYKNCPSDRTDISHQTCEECAEEHEQLATWLAELKRYKDLAEQGRLIELPCAVGDMVYTNQSMSGWYMQKKKRPYEAKIVFIGINGTDNFFNIEFKQGMMLQFKFSDIGKTVFLTKEEAEAKLKERGAE